MSASVRLARSPLVCRTFWFLLTTLVSFCHIRKRGVGTETVPPTRRRSVGLPGFRLASAGPSEGSLRRWGSTPRDPHLPSRGLGRSTSSGLVPLVPRPRTQTGLRLAETRLNRTWPILQAGVDPCRLARRQLVVTRAGGAAIPWHGVSMISSWRSMSAGGVSMVVPCLDRISTVTEVESRLPKPDRPLLTTETNSGSPRKPPARLPRSVGCPRYLGQPFEGRRRRRLSARSPFGYSARTSFRLSEPMGLYGHSWGRRLSPVRNVLTLSGSQLVP